jgi:hypothetical protein
VPTDLAENFAGGYEARLTANQATFKAPQASTRRRQGFVIPIQPQNLSTRAARDQNLLAVAAAAQGPV